MAIGGSRREAKDPDGAAAWFEASRNAVQPGLAEASLVGLMRLRLQQGDAAAVQALAEEHGRRFPAGQRKDEVLRMLQAL